MTTGRSGKDALRCRRLTMTNRPDFLNGRSRSDSGARSIDGSPIWFISLPHPDRAGKPCASDVIRAFAGPHARLFSEPNMVDIGSRIFREIFTVTSPWFFTSSAGLSIGALDIGGGGGVLYLKNGRTAEEQKLIYGIVGASIGPLPAGGSFSTPDMWSTGVGQIRTRVEGAMSFDDMTGAMCVVSGSAVGGPATMNTGLSTSIYFLGIPGLPAGAALAIPLVLNWLVTGALQARAVGMMVGRANGADVGLSVQFGYGR